ncbi:2-hexaprenyl-6-methoxy-1,4-benzoquinone methyltransferase [Vermiconidia calcicola]|uniref:2-hexaprenyl-6-methoxy-1,4-benzoquinone methyltransferase n=1 Tax=Vermiconidia calcicola TaxID=1690605 RepID=A0ACC3MSS7_9PEZI|nr:2-hexaprenyl-6-methoxy-1,4-benzoquinone methyltransferase [Vermiconidia calcicola]
MAALLPHLPKRIRLTPSSSTQWICRTCQQRRAFTPSSTALQTQPPPRPSQDDNKTTHFGYETISSTLKASRVGAVFSSVASNYDTMNDLMSLGIHRIWKDNFVRGLNPGIRGERKEGQRILDIAGGTGDIAQRMLDHATLVNDDKRTHVTISDINPEMLAEGRKRFGNSPYRLAKRVDFLEANAEDLSAIESGSIDLYTVAFGIRNFTHKDVALREAFRVLKPGGVFACLEFTPQLSNPVLNGIYKRWSFGAIPLIGQVVAGDRDSYQYLVESIERFPSQGEFRDMIREAGFLIPGRNGVDEEGERMGVGQGWEDLSLGIAAIHKGVKPV